MYDLKQIKSISCADVARGYGIQLKQQGDRLWGKLRPGENTSSFNINIKKNLWVDYGNANKGGSVIDLVMEIEGITKEAAINKLAADYNIEHIDQDKSTGNKFRGLTDSQYRELGIQPERATMNFAFDLTKHTPEQLSRWSEKYGMPVKDLAAQYPIVYNRMVVKIAMEGINILRDAYHSQVKKFHDPSTNDVTKAFLMHTSIEDAAELNKKIDLLQRAVTANAVNYAYLKVNLDKDFQVKQLTEDEKIRERLINAYKKLFNCNIIEHFTIDQAKALKDINFAISKDENIFVPIDSLKKAYTLLGENLNKLEKEYNSALNGGTGNIENVKNKIVKVKDLFTKASTVIEGIREANVSIKNDLVKQNVTEKPLEKSMDFSL